VVSWVNAALWGRTVAACTSAGALETHEHALETCEPSCVPRAAKPFLFLWSTVHRGRVTHGSNGAPLSGRQSPELWDTWQHRSSPPGRQISEPWDTWQRRSSPQQGGEVRGHGTRGSTGAHLSKEARSRATGHMAAPEPTSTGGCGLKVQLT
jgi:hypothetical protein